MFCAALFGAGIGFLWYNTYPAQVFMGDVGALALGGAIGMLAVLTKNELVLLIVGGLFVVEALSVIIQTGVFKATKRVENGKVVGKRVFRDGADPPPLRDQGLGRAEDHRPVLAGLRAARADRARHAEAEVAMMDLAGQARRRRRTRADRRRGREVLRRARRARDRHRRQARPTSSPSQIAQLDGVPRDAWSSAATTSARSPPPIWS